MDGRPLLLAYARRLTADSLEDWNDTPDRTLDDVLAALDHAAALTTSHDHDKHADKPSLVSPN